MPIGPNVDAGEAGVANMPTKASKLALSLASLTANANNVITFSGASTVANTIRIQNESATTIIYWELEGAASVGSASLASPAANAISVEWIRIPVTSFNIWVPAGGPTTLNSAAGGVKVEAWA